VTQVEQVFVNASAGAVGISTNEAVPALRCTS
jgi:hypothetical protein